MLYLFFLSLTTFLTARLFKNCPKGVENDAEYHFGTKRDTSSFCKKQPIAIHIRTIVAASKVRRG
jgi:hypothetical protein